MTDVGSSVIAPGTATLLRTAVTLPAVRKAQVVAVPPPSRAWVWKFTIGGGQPGYCIDGIAKRVPACWAITAA